MPLFEFRCKDCKQVFEKLVSGNAAQGPECPACGGKEVNKLLSTFAARGSSGSGGAPSGGGGCGTGCGCH